MSKVPLEFGETATPLLTGTDIYLTVVTSFLTCGIVHAGLGNVFPNMYPIVAYCLMGMTSILAGHHALLHSECSPRRRVWNAISHASNLVFISPFTIPVQIAQTVTNGVQINRNLFD